MRQNQTGNNYKNSKQEILQAISNSRHGEIKHLS